MAALGFYNSNEYRNYPFQGVAPILLPRTGGGSVPLPQAAIVEMVCAIGPALPFTPGVNTVYLETITNQAGTLLFDFRIDVPSGAQLALRFTRTAADREFATSWAQAVDATTGDLVLSLEPSGCPDPVIFEGYLVTGLLADLFAALAPGQSLTGSNLLTPLEPVLARPAPPVVVSLNLINQGRLMASTFACADDGAAIAAAPVRRPPVIAGGCIQAPIVLVEGYNTQIQIDSRTGTIRLGATPGAGAGQATGELPLSPGEVPPAGSPYLDGGPGCGQVISRLNGLPGPQVELTGSGVSITPHPFLKNRLVIDFTRRGQAACVPVSVGTSTARSEHLLSET